MQRFAFDRIPSPIGALLVASDGARLCALDFDDCEARMRALLARRFGVVELVETRSPAHISDRLQAYLAGDLRALEAIEVLAAGSAFQERAWAALRTIPPGQTATYAEQAARLGAPRAARAVGHANSLNPIAIVVPCHRVVGASGALTGFAGGLARKRWLLDHERNALGQHVLSLE